MPLADSKLFIGACRPETHGVCTNESLFHHHLSLLGKTNMTGSELALFLPSPPPKRPHQPLPNKVFLYEISQLYEEPYADTYRKDLADFLELHSPLPPITKTGSSSKSKVKAVDICEDKFIKLRAVLMENAMAASTWILRHFVDHPDVTVSNPEQFRAIMHTWMKDPCDARQK